MAVRSLILILLVLLLSGCARFAGGISPSTVPLQPGSYETLGPVRGEHCTYYVLGLFPLDEEPSASIAIRNTLHAKPGATALVNVAVTSQQAYWVLFSRGCISVDGTAVAVR